MTDPLLALRTRQGVAHHTGLEVAAVEDTARPGEPACHIRSLPVVVVAVEGIHIQAAVAGTAPEEDTVLVGDTVPAEGMVLEVDIVLEEDIALAGGTVLGVEEADGETGPAEAADTGPEEEEHRTERRRVAPAAAG